MGTSLHVRISLTSNLTNLDSSTFKINIVDICCRIIYEEAKETEFEKKETMFCKKNINQSGTMSSTSNAHGSVTSPVSPSQSMSCTVEDVLQLLRHLFVIYTRPENDNRICEYCLFLWPVRGKNVT